jgi:hypothetical protein
VPVCEGCEYWTQITTDLGRHADPHPLNSDFVAYSTIRKEPGSDDENRDRDEDIWLLWRGSANPAEWVRWQITAASMGDGDNFQPRWSPSGDRIAFVHGSASGDFEIWRVAVDVPATPDPTATPAGAIELVVTDGRDPAWLSDSEVLFVRDDNLYLVGGVTKSGRADDPVRLSYDPPTFAVAEEFIDRQPARSTDGAVVFGTIGRVDVADVLLRAFEDDGGGPVKTDAWIYIEMPGTDPFYPLFEMGDTLRTPGPGSSEDYLRLRSLPVNDGGVYTVGVRRDSRFLDPDVESYCDTTLTETIELQGGDVDSLDFTFRVVRGHLSIRSDSSLTAVTWEREDGLASHLDYSFTPFIQDPTDVLFYECVLAHAFDGRPLLRVRAGACLRRRRQRGSGLTRDDHRDGNEGHGNRHDPGHDHARGHHVRHAVRDPGAARRAR